MKIPPLAVYLVAGRGSRLGEATEETPKCLIAINKELEEHDQRQDYHVTWMAQLRDRIERLEKLQASSSKQQG